jgi:DUF1365 family protein
MSRPPASLYFGEVVHERMRPRKHRLRYRVFSLVADVDRLAEISAGSRLFAYNGRALFSVHDADHGKTPGQSLADWARQELAAAGLAHAGHHIDLLCYPRLLGYVFNPLSVYFCHDGSGTLAAIIYEVHNTFGERHAYVVAVDDGDRAVIRQEGTKEFFVSPFIPMDCGYKFRIQPPGRHVRVVMRVEDKDGLLLAASFNAKRRPFGDRHLARAALRYPLMTVKVIAGIHWEALKLWVKKAPVFDHTPAQGSGVTVIKNQG